MEGVRASRTAAADLSRLPRRRSRRRSAGCWMARCRACSAGVHVLPPFPSSGDRGFAPHHLSRDRAGVRDLGGHPGARHGPRRAPRPDGQSHQPAERGVPGLPAARQAVARTPTCSSRSTRSGPTVDLLPRMWPASSCASPTTPFSTITVGDTGEQLTVWTTFGTADWSEQVDLDLRSDATRRADRATGSRSSPRRACGSCAWMPSATS